MTRPAPTTGHVVGRLAECICNRNRPVTQKTTQPIQFPENIELVKKYREQIDAVLQ